MIPHDPIIDELRKVREEYASELNYDLDAIYRDLKEKQKQGGKRYIHLKLLKK
ncbi:MAG: hypothetical protein HC887_05540 [Desulfobacteraceae bacterium]|nr:hypothetical protein [Desulfobacteraceae bacterium]